jgi:hypothetical protein
MKDQRTGFQVVGYPDERGAGTPVIIAGAELGRRKVMEAWSAIKPGHKFPKGIKLAVLEERREADKAIFISETIAGEQEAAAEIQAGRDRAAAQKKLDAAKKKAQSAEIDKAVRDMAVARDGANFELLAATADRDNAKSNATETESNILTPASKKLFQGRLETAEARLEKATKAFAAADKAWLDAKAARTKINQTNLSA